MNMAFVKLANMSVSAAWLILVVLVLRLLLKRAPRWITCLLWALVAVRLVCPVSLQSALSAYQVAVPEAVREGGQVEYFQYVHESGDKPSIMLDISALGGAGDTAPAGEEDTPREETVRHGNPTRYLPPYVALWLTVGAALLLYGLASTLRLRYRVREAMRLRENIWVCDAVTSPFLLGLLRPRIYLPSGMDEGELRYVLAHEQAHLRRGDHIWKPLGYLLLALHWFNPLVWLAYCLFCRDIETACDERVVRTLDAAEKKAYSTALLSCSQGRRMVLACPVAFGEVGVRSRIRSVLRYKKPAFWVIVAAVAACIVVAVCFLTDPPAVEGGVADPQAAQSDDASQTDTESVRWSYDSSAVSVPCMTVNGGGTVFYMEIPDQLAEDIRQRVAENVPLSGFTAPQLTNGWGRDLISWSAEKAEVHLVFAEDYSEFYSLCRGESGVWGLNTQNGAIQADGEVRELLDMIAALTGWETDRGREAFSGLTRAELIYNGRTLYTVTDAARLGSLQSLLQNGTQAGYASKTPMERVELRMTCGDGSTVSVLLDTDSPRIFLPPFYYYEYNDYESTGTLPLLEALGLTAWPEETKDADCSPWLNDLLAELVPSPEATSDNGGRSRLPLTAEGVQQAAERCGMELTLAEDETYSTSAGGITYTLRNGDGQGTPLCAVSGGAYENGGYVLHVTYRVKAGEDTGFRWEDWRTVFALAAELYGGYQEAGELYRSLALQDIPEDSGDNGAAWLVDTRGGYCSVRYSVTENPAGESAFVGVNVSLYESETEYREAVRRMQQE